MISLFGGLLGVVLGAWLTDFFISIRIRKEAKLEIIIILKSYKNCIDNFNLMIDLLNNFCNLDLTNLNELPIETVNNLLKNNNLVKLTHDDFFNLKNLNLNSICQIKFINNKKLQDIIDFTFSIEKSANVALFSYQQMINRKNLLDTNYYYQGPARLQKINQVKGNLVENIEGIKNTLSIEYKKKFKQQQKEIINYDKRCFLYRIYVHVLGVFNPK